MKVKDDLVKNDKAKLFKQIFIGCNIIFTPPYFNFLLPCIAAILSKNSKDCGRFFFNFSLQTKKS
mgnify:CR=1 FL=1